jgi:hypothetical protein
MTTRFGVGLRVLVVAQAPAVAITVVQSLGSLDLAADLVVMTNFDRAKRHLISGVDLLITEVKLGAYNGLHLAVRALAAGIPSIVLGPDDVGLEHDAARLGAAYVANATLTERILASTITELVTVRHDVTGCRPWGTQSSDREPAVASVLLH